jgi:hypothetical protein
MNLSTSLDKASALLTPLLAAAMLTSAASANVILSETFLDNQRLVQNLPNTSAWFGSQATSLTQPSEGMITSITGQTFLTYFTDSGTVSLAVGEILRVSFDFQLGNPVTPASHSGIRAGLMNSTTGGGRVAADGFGSSNALFAGYTGYGGWIHPQGADTRLRERTDMSHSGLLNNNTGWANRTTNTVNATPILADTTYTGVFLIARASDRVIASYSVSGPNFNTVTVTYEHVGSNLFAFDTFGIWTNSTHGDTFSLTAFDVTVIPEPSVYALLIGIVTALVLGIRRRS